MRINHGDHDEELMCGGTVGCGVDSVGCIGNFMGQLDEEVYVSVLAGEACNLVVTVFGLELRGLSGCIWVGAEGICGC